MSIVLQKLELVGNRTDVREFVTSSTTSVSTLPSGRALHCLCLPQVPFSAAHQGLGCCVPDLDAQIQLSGVTDWTAALRLQQPLAWRLVLVCFLRGPLTNHGSHSISLFHVETYSAPLLFCFLLDTAGRIRTYICRFWGPVLYR